MPRTSCVHVCVVCVASLSLCLSSAGEVLLLLVLDAAGILHVLSEQGAELLRQNLRRFHKKDIVVTDVEAHSGGWVVGGGW
jgi:hypothetical protein